MTGNVKPGQKHITFLDQVRAIYGPVATWEARLDPDSPGGLLPDTMFVTCQQMTLSEIGPKVPGQGNQEMAAEGNIRLEDQGVQGDLYTAEAARMTYSEAKDLVVLRGDSRVPAELDTQTGPAAARSSLRAGTINYWRRTKQTKLEDWKFGEGNFNQPQQPGKK